jgi:glucosamine--fructose-6-phosphate aminotransferase (isomerizing)
MDRLCNGCLEFEENKAFLVAALRQVLDTETQIHSIAEGLRHARDIYVIGRSVHYAVALEAALKIKELAYVHAEGIAAGELKHGPLTVIDKNSIVLVINPNDTASEDNIAGAYEIKARGATIIGISDRPNNVYDIFIKIPSAKNTIIYPIIEVLPFQIIAYYLALAKNADPDYPRNLAKSVTVK